MRADRAAAYLGMSEASFLRLVAESVFPAGIMIKGMRVWDRYDLDTAFENLKDGREANRNFFEKVLGSDSKKQTSGS
jgi:predicted DNA-binding transcriptional regulator AlpA